MIAFTHEGDFDKTIKFLKHITDNDIANILQQYAQQGIDALASATPIDTGLTALSWGYEIVRTKNSIIIHWTNDNIVDGIPISVILQYGHGTRNGGYVQGRDYINPAIRPVFDQIAEAAWREVKS